MLPAFTLALRGPKVTEVKGIPAAVLLHVDDAATRQRTIGSGCLIAPRMVLTAAHCVDAEGVIEIIAPYAKDGAKSVEVEKIVRHPRYRRGEFDHDCALLWLKEPITIEGDFPTLHRGNLLRIETALTVVGRVREGKASTDRLFMAPVTLVAFPDNLNLYGGFPQTVQHGDSGGPIFIEGKPEVIVALTTGFLEFNRRNVKTDGYLPISTKLREWIIEQQRMLMR